MMWVLQKYVLTITRVDLFHTLMKQMVTRTANIAMCRCGVLPLNQFDGMMPVRGSAPA